MALTVGNRYLAEEFISLKARVKAEMLRRKYNGTLVSYGSSKYDYEVQPEAGNVVLAEHFNKIVEPLNAINDTGLTTKYSGDLIVAMETLDTFLTKSEGYALTSKTTNCKASCSGLCVTGCGSGCSGCTGTCSNNCTGCSGCGNSCSRNCDTTCSAKCMYDCEGACAEGCSSSCMGGCKYTCSSGCSTQCKGTCLSTCTGNCKGTCKNDCLNTSRL